MTRGGTREGRAVCALLSRLVYHPHRGGDRRRQLLRRGDGGRADAAPARESTGARRRRCARRSAPALSSSSATSWLPQKAARCSAVSPRAAGQVDLLRPQRGEDDGGDVGEASATAWAASTPPRRGPPDRRCGSAAARARRRPSPPAWWAGHGLSRTSTAARTSSMSHCAHDAWLTVAARRQTSRPSRRPAAERRVLLGAAQLGR